MVVQIVVAVAMVAAFGIGSVQLVRAWRRRRWLDVAAFAGAVVIAAGVVTITAVEWINAGRDASCHALADGVVPDDGPGCC